MEEENIYPIFDRMLSRKDKEELLGQRGVMLWLTGLSGSGKRTNVNYINVVCSAVYWTGIIFVVASIIIWAFRQRIVWKTSVA